MSRLRIATVAIGALALAVAPIASAANLASDEPLFRPIVELAGDSHVQGMDTMLEGPAETPPGAPSEGQAIGQTFAGSTLLGNIAGKAPFKGNALVVRNGKAWIGAAGGPIDDFAAGAGYRADFPKVAVSQFQVEIITPQVVEIEVEAFFLGESLAPPQKVRINGDNNLLRWSSGGVFFDRIEIRSVHDSTGWGLDNLSAGGNMSARPVVCRDLSYDSSNEAVFGLSAGGQ